MQYVLTDTSVLQISESSGVIQNVGSYEIELSATADFAESFVLRERQKVSFNKQLYIKTRDPTPHSVKVNVVTFITEGSGGGSSSSVDEAAEHAENVNDYLDDLLNDGNNTGYDNQDVTDYFDDLLNG